MVKLKIINKDNYLYKLVDDRENNYEFSFEFFDIESSPEIGDYISISAELLNPSYAGYSTLYTFGSLDNPCGKSNIDSNDIDVIKVITENKEIVLKRLYG